MLRLFDHAASANCLKVRLLLAQLGRDYERVAIDIFDGGTFTDEFVRLNPRREVPVLELEDGRLLVESDAILWYLGAGTPFLPAEPAHQAELVRWLIFEQTEVMPMVGGLRFRLITGRIEPDGEEAERRRRGAHEGLATLDGHLASRAFLVGDTYSIADVAVYAYSHLGEEAGIGTSAYPAFRAWLARVEATRGFVNDLEPYPPNASVLAGRSIYG